jgi:transcriptional regulator with XRE-family HTH domain
MRDEDGLEMLLTVRRRVRKWREYRGWSIYQLSEISKISHTTIYRLEEGHHTDIQLSTLHALARALQVPLSKLLTGF